VPQKTNLNEGDMKVYKSMDVLKKLNDLNQS
jgi:hypothetical protein